MAFNFNGTTGHIELTDHASLTLPDGDWTIAIWVRYAASDSNARYFLSWGSFYGTPSINYFIHGNSGNARFIVNDSDDDFVDASAAGGATRDVWTHVILQRTAGGVFKGYYDNSEILSETESTLDAIDRSDAMYIGARSDDETTRAFDGDCAEFGKWDRALTSDERQELADGHAPSFIQQDLKVYVPMIRDYVELRSGITVTNSGSTVVAHPPMIYPSIAKVVSVAGATIFTQALAGALSFTGALSTVHLQIYLKALAGALSFSGGLSALQVFVKGLTGSLSFAGGLSTVHLQIYLKALAGALSFSGGLSALQVYVKGLSGALSFAGGLTTLQTFVKALSGALSFSGSVVGFLLAVPVYLKNRFEAIIIKILDD